jgi:uncharacterized protein (DUF934 family)
MSSAARIILDGVVVADDWTLISATEEFVGVVPTGKSILPLRLWIAHREALLRAATETDQPLGVWLDSNDDPAVLEGVVNRFDVIAVNFPKFTDGRGYSIAALLRSRYGFKGELRAIGDVLRDQLFYMQRSGFNAFSVRADRDINDAVTALADFSETYQGAIDEPLPLFRRRAQIHASQA